MIVQRHTHINEWLVYGLLAALLILLALLGMLLVRFLWPAPARYDLGTVAALRARAPQRRDLADGLSSILSISTASWWRGMLCRPCPTAVARCAG